MSLSTPTTARPLRVKNLAASAPIRPPAPVMMATLIALPSPAEHRAQLLVFDPPVDLADVAFVEPGAGIFRERALAPEARERSAFDLGAAGFLAGIEGERIAVALGVAHLLGGFAR